MRPSMQDIAQRLGVSRSAVSFVLSGKAEEHRIAPQTAQLILQTAHEMGFRRNELAASVKTGRSNTIAYIGGACTDYHMKLVAGINSGLSGQGYGLRLFDIYDDAMSAEEIADRCLRGMIDGVVAGALNSHYQRVVRQVIGGQNIPIVRVDCNQAFSWCRSVGSDDRSGAALAVCYLASLGRRRIGLFSNDESQRESMPRNAGYYDGLREVGLPRLHELEYYCRPESKFPLWQREEIADYLRNAKPDAIFCVGDPGAMRILHVANALGIRIPQELAVIGFADLEYAQYSSPPLTTLRQPFFEIGQLAAHYVLEAIRTGQPYETNPTKNITLLPVELILRDSTGSYPAER